MMPLCADQGVGVIPWSPLARGGCAAVEQKQSPSARSSDEFGKRLYPRPEEADRHVVDRVGQVASNRTSRGRRWRWRGC